MKSLRIAAIALLAVAAGIALQQYFHWAGVAEARKQLTFKLVNELGLSLAETGRQLGLTTSGVAQILRRKR